MDRFFYLKFLTLSVVTVLFSLLAVTSPVNAGCDTSGCTITVNCGSGQETLSCSRPDGQNCGCGDGGASTCRYGDDTCAPGTVSYSWGCNQDTLHGWITCNNSCDCGGPSCTSPKGNFDAADCDDFEGWACDGDNFSQPLTINFYADLGRSILIGSTVANQTRDDGIANECGTYSNHSFGFVLPSSLRDGQNHTIYAYGVNIGGACADTHLTNSPKTINCPLPTPTPTRIPTPTPTRVPTATPTITPTSTPTVSLSCVINVPPDPASVPQGGSLALSATVSYTGARTISHSWTATCGSVSGVGPSATYQASGVTVGDYCKVMLAVSENGGSLTDDCDKWVSITGTGQGMLSGYVLTDKGATCTRDIPDSGLGGKTVELRGSSLPGSTITDSNGYFSFLRPVGNIYNLVYTLGVSEQPSPSCALPVRSGNELTYPDLTVVSAGLGEKNFYISPGAVTGNPAWIQTRAGDVHANSNILLNIPSGSYFADTENSLVTSFSDALFDLANGQPEHDTRGVRGNHWYTTYPYNITKMQSGNKFLDFFSLKYPPEATISGNVLDQTSFTTNDGKIAIIGDGDTSNLDDISLSTMVDLPSNSSNVIYVSDNLNINNSITLSGNSVAIFVVKGNLNIESLVTSIDGVFFVDGTINTRGTTSGNSVLAVNGMLYSSSTGKMFGRSRDLGLGNINPAEIIIYQPKYILNQRLLELFGKKDYVWQEVPG